MNKKIVEQVKTSESKISLFLGIAVIIVVGGLLFNYFKGLAGKMINQNENKEVQSENISEAINEEGKTTGKTFTGELPTKYVVEKNDSLWTISIKFFGEGYNWVDIGKENNLQNPGTLLVGQELTIPKVEPKTVVVKKVIPSAEGATIEGDSYTVQKGDNLWEISVRAYQDGYKWSEIAKANKISNPNIIHPGTVLTIAR